MRWYVLQTITGQEEKLVKMIRRIVPAGLYGECFVLYHEQLWRRHQKNLIHVVRTFPGYVFITADRPEELFLCLRQVPAMSKMIADGAFHFLALEKEEEQFLRQIANREYVISLSFLATDGHGNVRQVTGPLQSCVEQVEQYRFQKRYAVVRLSLAGQEKQVLLGFVLREDIRREIGYGKVEAPLCPSEPYRIPTGSWKSAAEAKDAEQGNGTDRIPEPGGTSLPGSARSAGKTSQPRSARSAEETSPAGSVRSTGKTSLTESARSTGKTSQPGSARSAGKTSPSESAKPGLPESARSAEKTSLQGSATSAGKASQPGSATSAGKATLSGEKGGPGDARSVNKEAEASLRPGDLVMVVSGDLAGTSGRIRKIKKNTVRMAIPFAEKELEIEVPADTVRR